jgi:hypothetical protein
MRSGFVGYARMRTISELNATGCRDVSNNIKPGVATPMAIGSLLRFATSSWERHFPLMNEPRTHFIFDPAGKPFDSMEGTK